MQRKQYSPDTELFLISALGAFFVLVKTDFFEKGHEEKAIREIFDVVSVNWVQPNLKFVVSVESDETGEYIDMIDPTIKQGNSVYALTVVTMKQNL
jgi:hypothetical protein